MCPLSPRGAAVRVTKHRAAAAAEPRPRSAYPWPPSPPFSLPRTPLRVWVPLADPSSSLHRRAPAGRGRESRTLPRPSADLPLAQGPFPLSPPCLPLPPQPYCVWHRGGAQGPGAASSLPSPSFPLFLFLNLPSPAWCSLSPTCHSPGLCSRPRLPLSAFPRLCLFVLPRPFSQVSFATFNSPFISCCLCLVSPVDLCLPESFFPCLSVSSQYLSVSLGFSFLVSFSLFMSLSVSLCFSASLWVSKSPSLLSICLSLSLDFFLSFFLSCLCLSLHISFFLFLRFSLRIPMSLSLFPSASH